MRSGAAAMFVLLFLIESELSGGDGKELCGSGGYSLADPCTLLWGEGVFCIQPTNAEYKLEGRRRRTKEVWSKN